jgi:hypothetical protein
MPQAVQPSTQRTHHKSRKKTLKPAGIPSTVAFGTVRADAESWVHPERHIEALRKLLPQHVWEDLRKPPGPRRYATIEEIDAYINSLEPEVLDREAVRRNVPSYFVNRNMIASKEDIVRRFQSDVHKHRRRGAHRPKRK